MAKPASSKRGLTLLQCSDRGQKGWWEQAMCKSLTSFQKPLQPPGLLGLWKRGTGERKPRLGYWQGRVEKGKQRGASGREGSPLTALGCHLKAITEDRGKERKYF